MKTTTITIDNEMDRTIILTALQMYRERMYEDSLTYRRQGNTEASEDCRKYFHRASEIGESI